MNDNSNNQTKEKIINIFNDLKEDYIYVNNPQNKKSFDYKDGYNDAVRDLIIIIEKTTQIRLKF